MKLVLASAVLAVSSFVPAVASAQLERDYRRLDRPSYESPQSFAFELRFGPYKPRVDEEFGGRSTPFADTFGNGNGLYVGVEFDWQAVRIPYIGTIGPGAGWGYTRRSAIADVACPPGSPVGCRTGIPSAESTYLMIMPMYLDAVFRIDVFARDIGIPLVPYLKGGLGYALWQASNDGGTSRYHGELTDPTVVGRLGRGHTFGLHYAAGGMFLLDALDPGAALAFDSEVGVNNSYIFFEWQLADLAGQVSFLDSSPQMHVGTSSWVLGLALEF